MCLEEVLYLSRRRHILQVQPLPPLAKSSQWTDDVKDHSFSRTAASLGDYSDQDGPMV